MLTPNVRRLIGRAVYFKTPLFLHIYIFFLITEKNVAEKTAHILKYSAA